MNASTSAPGSRGAAPASRTSSWRATASACRTLPQVNDRRNDPSVDGARRPPNRSAIAPCRSTSMSSMLSAPAAIPATRQPAFRPAFTPHFALILTCSPIRSVRPQRSARAMTGTRPARDTRFGSSNDACVFAGSCNNRTCEVSSPARQWKRQQLPSSQLRGHLSRRHASKKPYLHGGFRLSLDPPMISMALSRSPRSDPDFPSQETALTRCGRKQRRSGR